MEMIKPGTQIDFMKYRAGFTVVSVALVLLSLASLYWPGPNFGIDFAGGTELQLRFEGDVDAAELRAALERAGHAQSDVVSVEGRRDEYIIRVEEVSALPPAEQDRIEEGLRAAAGARVTQFDVSPGGDKISLRFDAAQDPRQIEAWLRDAGADVRSANSFGSPDEFRYEAHLIGVGDEIVRSLQEQLGERAPESALRIEWVGPRAGAQLRDAAIESILYAVVFIMLYVAFRFDVRFAPGSIVALLHDVVITLGVYVVLQREVTLTTVAALLTILGISINDTIVVYDRIRENMARAKDQSLREIINTSTSQVLSRTIITSGTTALAMVAFLIWGTPVLQNLAFALIVGQIVGTYSSVYIAAPVTEWVDKRFFARRTAKA
jgi:preprotein translocase subunit SecF